MNDFQFIKELGSGSFGRVIQVRPHSNQNQVYAMKQIKMNQLNAREKDNALNEVRLLASIDSPNIISYKRAFFEEFGSTLCILMEFADGGDLAVYFSSPRVSSRRKRKKCISSVRTSSGRSPTTSLRDSKYSMTTTLYIAISNPLTSSSWLALLKSEISMFPKYLRVSMLPLKLELLTIQVPKFGITSNMMAEWTYGH
jgi:serine/threonine protein kinase